jgi:hypothetical protein
MTAKHYASADSVANARVARASETLAPSQPQSTAERITKLLSQLSADELSELRRRLVV